MVFGLQEVPSVSQKPGHPESDHTHPSRQAAYLLAPPTTPLGMGLGFGLGGCRPGFFRSGALGGVTETVAWQHARQQIVPSSSPSHAVTLLSTQEQSQSLPVYGADGCSATSSVAWGGSSCATSGRTGDESGDCSGKGGWRGGAEGASLRQGVMPVKGERAR